MREMLRQQNQAEKDYIHQKNLDYIYEKKEAKDIQDNEEKENMNQKLLEAVKCYCSFYTKVHLV